MLKIAMIGAGSIVFAKTLMNDMLSTPALQHATYALVDLNESKLHSMEAFVQRMISENNLPAQVCATTDRRKAICGQAASGRDADHQYRAAAAAAVQRCHPPRSGNDMPQVPSQIANRSLRERDRFG